MFLKISIHTFAMSRNDQPLGQKKTRKIRENEKEREKMRERGREKRGRDFEQILVFRISGSEGSLVGLLA